MCCEIQHCILNSYSIGLIHNTFFAFQITQKPQNYLPFSRNYQTMGVQGKCSNQLPKSTNN
jgi:hypothetical protein